MNNLLFTALCLALLYYFFFYLPNQKKLIASPPFKQNQETQTELDENPEIIKELRKDNQQKERTIMDLNNSYEKLKTEKEEQIERLKQIQEEAENILSKEVVVIIPSEENSLLAYCRVIVEKIRDLEKDKQKLSSWKDGKVVTYRSFATPRQLNPEDLETRKHGVVMISALRKYKNILLMDQGPWTEEKLAEHQSKLEICQQILVTFEANLELEEEGYW